MKVDHPPYLFPIRNNHQTLTPNIHRKAKNNPISRKSSSKRLRERQKIAEKKRRPHHPLADSGIDWSLCGQRPLRLPVIQSSPTPRLSMRAWLALSVCRSPLLRKLITNSTSDPIGLSEFWIQRRSTGSDRYTLLFCICVKIDWTI